MSDRQHHKIPGSEASHNGYLGQCWCQGSDDAWPCPTAHRVTAGHVDNARQESTDAR